MAFIQPCFIRKKTTELVDKLIAMGYNHPSKYHEIFPNLLTIPYKGHGWATLIAVSDKEIDLALKLKINENKTIDCGDNEELFLALAALRDDIDKNQWFVNRKNDWYLCKDNKFCKETADWLLVIFADNWHKAAVEEIIEHFK